MRTYKSPKAILRHARDFLADPNNWSMGNLDFCVRRANYSPGDKVEDAPLLDLATIANEHCVYCALGAVGHFSDPSVLSSIPSREGAIQASPAGQLLEEAARAMYGSRAEVINVNDGSYHETPSGAWRATLRMFDKAIELAS